MKYAIQVSGGPTEPQTANIAANFSRALLLDGHEIIRVFFYGDGVRHAFNAPSLVHQSDWLGMNTQPGTTAEIWTALVEEFGLELVYCSTAAELRGLSGSVSDILPSVKTFQAGGLGLWVDACIRADKVIEFAG